MNLPSVLAPASLEALALTEVAWVLIVGALVVCIVTLALGAAGLRTRRQPVPTAWWVLGGGVAFPAVVLTALLGYGTWRTHGFESALPPGALIVNVTGRMWWWDIRYVDPASGRSVGVANELRLPVGRPVRLALTSGDVIHSFWVPELAGKVDMVPGRINALAFTPTRPGVYRGPCAEFCGVQHARMTLHVVAQEGAAFDAWLAGQARDAAAPIGSLSQSGRQAFLDNGCSACHSVRGVASASTLGPDLTHVGSRLHLGAGVLRNQPGAMAAWIANVQALKPGARMASAHALPADTLNAIAAYLEGLQ